MSGESHLYVRISGKSDKTRLFRLRFESYKKGIASFNPLLERKFEADNQ